MSGSDAERAWLGEVGLRIRLARVQVRESQDWLAERAGVSRATVSSVERGEHPGNVLVYRRLAGALGVSLGRLIGEAQ